LAIGKQRFGPIPVEKVTVNYLQDVVLKLKYRIGKW
jgi:hypothetical protein